MNLPTKYEVFLHQNCTFSQPEEARSLKISCSELGETLKGFSLSRVK